MKYLLILVLGLVIGAGVAIFFLGIPRAKAIPGTPVGAPVAGAAPASTVVMSVNENFLNELLNTVFRDLGPPTFNLSSKTTPDVFERVAFQGGCTNSVTLAPEGSNAKTQVRFAGGTISAPLVFSGSYSLMGNCMQFKGWAQTSIQLSFDQAAQTVYGRVSVDGVNLEGVPPIANNFVTVFVRDAIDSKVNPLEFLRPSQLQLVIPVKGINGSVKTHVKDVRSEAQDGVLRLHITYDFAATKDGQPQG
ncbi:MAG TPA: hypothetical protein VMS31_13020 [Pyrinomonadaceae bacterium]|nr:hypothetical protein [Pyrinomonadaceae bacterium]